MSYKNKEIHKKFAHKKIHKNLTFAIFYIVHLLNTLLRIFLPKINILPAWISDLIISKTVILHTFAESISSN